MELPTKGKESLVALKTIPLPPPRDLTLPHALSGVPAENWDNCAGSCVALAAEGLGTAWKRWAA